MAIIATSNGGGANFQPIEAGSYVARCYSMIHIGTIEEVIMGVAKKLNKVRVTWELPTELKVFKEENGEQPQIISKEFTLSLHEKSTLRAFLKNWRGLDFTEEEAKEFDVTKLIGAPCMLNITHKNKKDGSGVYAEIGSVSKLPKGLSCPDAINEPFVFTYDDYSLDKFNALPEYLRSKMINSDEYKALSNPAEVKVTHSHEEEDNDVPF